MDAKKRVTKAARPLSTFEITLQVQSGVTEKEANLLSQLNNAAMDDKQNRAELLSAEEAESTETEDGSYSGDDLIELSDEGLPDTFEPDLTKSSISSITEREDGQSVTNDAQEHVDDIEQLSTPLTYAEDVADNSLDMPPKYGHNKDINLPINTILQTEGQIDDQHTPQGSEKVNGNAGSNKSENNTSPETLTDEEKAIQENEIRVTAEKIAESAIQDAFLLVKETPKDKGELDDEFDKTSEESLLPAPSKDMLQSSENHVQPADLPSPPPIDEEAVQVDLPPPPSLQETEEATIPVPPPSLIISPPEGLPSPPGDILHTDQLPSPPPSADLRGSMEEDLPLPPLLQNEEAQDELPAPPDVVLDVQPKNETQIDDAQETAQLIDNKPAETAECQTDILSTVVKEQSQQESKDRKSEPYVEPQNTAIEAGTSQNGKSSTSEPEGSSQKETDVLPGAESANKSNAQASETQPLQHETAPGTSRGEEALKPAKKGKATKSCCALM